MKQIILITLFALTSFSLHAIETDLEKGERQPLLPDPHTDKKIIKKPYCFYPEMFLVSAVSSSGILTCMAFFMKEICLQYPEQCNGKQANLNPSYLWIPIIGICFLQAIIVANLIVIQRITQQR